MGKRARRGYVGKPGPIELKLGDITVEARGANSAVTEFRQGYTSADYTDEVIKRLEWVRRSGCGKSFASPRVEFPPPPDKGPPGGPLFLPATHSASGTLQCVADHSEVS